MDLGRRALPQAEEDEVGDRREDLNCWDLPQRREHARALARGELEAVRDRLFVARDPSGDGERQGAHVVGQRRRGEEAHQFRTDDERSDPQSGRRQDLRERLGDDHVRELGAPADKRGSREIGIRLVDQHERLGVLLGD